MKKLDETHTAQINGGGMESGDPFLCNRLYAFLLSQDTWWYIKISNDYWSDWEACPQYVDDI